MSVEAPSLSEEQDKIRTAIRRLLRVYPKVSKTMLASHINPYGWQMGIDWEIVLNHMLDEGEIIRESVLLDNRASVVYRLPEEERIS